MWSNNKRHTRFTRQPTKVVVGPTYFFLKPKRVVIVIYKT